MGERGDGRGVGGEVGGVAWGCCGWDVDVCSLRAGANMFVRFVFAISGDFFSV